MPPVGGMIYSPAFPDANRNEGCVYSFRNERLPPHPKTGVGWKKI